MLWSEDGIWDQFGTSIVMEGEGHPWACMSVRRS